MDNSQKILDELLSRGIISQELIDEVDKCLPSKTLLKCAEYLHTTLCPLNHDDEGCNYYNEERTEGDCWVKPIHKEWIEKVRETINYLSINNEEDLLNVLTSASEILQKYKSDSILLASMMQDVYSVQDFIDFPQIFGKVCIKI